MSWIWICPADRTRPALQPRFSVVIAKRPHPFPFRTRKLSSSAPMVLHGRLCGRVGRRRILTPRALTYFTSGPVSFPLHSPFPFPPLPATRLTHTRSLFCFCPKLVMYYRGFGDSLLSFGISVNDNRRMPPDYRILITL